MDRGAIKEKVSAILRKNKYVLLILAVGLALMLLPTANVHENTQPQQVIREPEQPDTQERLQALLNRIEGAGKVELLLTIGAGESVIYQCDEDSSGGDNGSLRVETVIVTDADRAQSGLIQQINPPVYMGAVVVCEGADRAAVRLQIMDAVSKATGLGMDRISVLKMK